MVKGSREALLEPLLAEIVMTAEVPSLSTPGVPVRAPLLVLKVAQFGFPVIE